MNKFSIKKITLAQQKILMSVIVILSVFLAAWFFLYFPLARQFSALKKELATTEQRIAAIETVAGQDKSFSQGIESLKEKLKQLNMKFPPKEEEGLKVISDLARKIELDVVSVQVQPRAVFRDTHQQEVKIESKTCRMVSASIELKGRFKDLGRYLELLKTVMPVYVTVEKLAIQSDGATIPTLRITLSLNLYLLS